MGSCFFHGLFTFQTSPLRNKRHQRQNSCPNTQLCQTSGICNRPRRQQPCPQKPPSKKNKKKSSHKKKKKMSKTRFELVTLRLLVKSSTIKLHARKKIVHRKNRTFFSSLGNFCSAIELYAHTAKEIRTPKDKIHYVLSVACLPFHHSCSKNTGGF